MLKRWSDAVRDGDNVLALIRGSAVNQDGRSAGLTAPNGLAQQAVIEAALAAGEVEAGEVSYVEAHGTGTPLGDPIEMGALARVYGAGRRREEPLVVGSVKTNVGHLEAAAGVAGVIKVVLALQHGEIPPHLHFKRPNPHIRWEEIAVRIPVERTEWQGVNGRRLAGVSSFGFGGTNAHLIVEGVEKRARAEGERERPLHVLSLSAKEEAGLGRDGGAVGGAPAEPRRGEIGGCGVHGECGTKPFWASVGGGGGNGRGGRAEAVGGGGGGEGERSEARESGACGGARGGVSVHGAGIAVCGDGAAVI